MTIPRIREATSGVAARRARICSAPKNSLVSQSTEVPPWATSQSETSPMRGLDPRPLVVSEPPQLVPRTSSEMSQGSRRSEAARSASLPAMRVPSSTARMEPPTCWITRVSTGLSVRSRMASTTRSFWHPSHPRDTASTELTLGLAANPAMVSMVTCWSAGTWEHPFWLWNETQPSTLRAMRSVVSEAQMLVGSTSTWLRMPTRPSGRR